MARRSHKMIGANDNVRGTGMPSQANSITAPSARVFVSCEDSLPATTVQDIIGSTAFIDNAVSTDNQISAGDDAYSLNIGALPPSNQVAGNPATWSDPAGSDWIYFAVIRAKVNPSDPFDGYAVYLEQLISGNDASVRIFPYMMTFRDNREAPIKEVFTRNIDTDDWSWMWNGGDPASGLGWTCDHCEGWNLVDGQVYSVGGAREGDWLYHYFNGKLVGRVNVREAYAGTYPNPAPVDRELGGDISIWENFDGGQGIELTHSGYSGVGCIDYNGDQTVGHYPSDHYGTAQFIFAGGLPSQESIEYNMNLMKEEWIKNNKILPPEWMTL